MLEESESLCSDILPPPPLSLSTRPITVPERLRVPAAPRSRCSRGLPLEGERAAIRLGQGSAPPPLLSPYRNVPTPPDEAWRLASIRWSDTHGTVRNIHPLPQEMAIIKIHLDEGGELIMIRLKQGGSGRLKSPLGHFSLMSPTRPDVLINSC